MKSLPYLMPSCRITISAKTVRMKVTKLIYIPDHLRMCYSNFIGASLSESFYGLTRCNTKSQRFTTRDRVVSLLFLVVVPYLSRKLDTKMTKLKEKLQDEVTLDDKYQILGLYSYRSVKASYEFLQIIKYVSYLAGYSKTHSIQLMLGGMTLRHANYQEDPISWRELFSGHLKLSTVFGTMMLRGLEFGGFFLQFIQWWQDSSSTQKSIGQLPIPEPPKVDYNANRYLNVCPICLQEILLPTVLQISGYVFCYKCITKHLKKQQFCPVTNYPSTIDDLVRLYDN